MTKKRGQIDEIQRTIMICATTLPVFGFFIIAGETTDIFSETGWLYKWQTLVAGLIAIAAALIGAYFVNKQIMVSSAIEANRVARKFAAARSVLPLTLDSLSDYAMQSAVVLKGIYDHRAKHIIPPGLAVPERPRISPDFITEMRVLVEFSGDDSQTFFEDVLQKIQIHQARLNGLWRSLSGGNEIIIERDVAIYIIDSIIIYLLASLNYKYARRQADKTEVTIKLKDLKSSLETIGLFEEEGSRIYEIASLMATE